MCITNLLPRARIENEQISLLSFVSCWRNKKSIENDGKFQNLLVLLTLLSQHLLVFLLKNWRYPVHEQRKQIDLFWVFYSEFLFKFLINYFSNISF